MKSSESNAVEKGASSYIVINSVSDSNPSEKPTPSPSEKPKRQDWRQTMLQMKDNVAVVLAVVKLLQDLGLF